MKPKYLLYPIVLLFIVMIVGCDDYTQKTIQKNIYVDRLELDLFVGETVQLTASPTDGTYSYTWSSDNPEVATVTSNGLVEAVGKGSANIIVTSGELSTKVPLNAIVRIPLQDVIISETLLELKVGDKRTITVTLVPDGVNDLPSYSWSSEDPSIATVSLSGEVKAVAEGVTYIVYKIGDIEKKVKIDVATTRAFRGPHVLSAAGPYELMAANFDFGGPGLAYHDSDDHDHTGQNNSYRRSHGDDVTVGVEIEGGGNNVGYTNSGEWLLYTVEVLDAGDYLVEAQLATPHGSAFHIEVDNVNVSGRVNAPNTGGWGAPYAMVPAATVNFTEGRHKVKFYFEEGNLNVRALWFTKQ